MILLLIYMHAALGGLGLVTGYLNLMPKKGSKLHRKIGRVFVFSMASSSATALIISVWPEHENPFLFCIGIFTLYMVLTGNRALKWFKGLKTFDYILFYTMGICSLAMLILGIQQLVQSHSVGYLFLIFGGIGGSGTIQDIFMAKKENTSYDKGLSTHISRILGGLIAATTAFIIVNQWIPGLWGWLSPTVLGTTAIIYFQRARNRA